METKPGTLTNLDTLIGTTILVNPDQCVKKGVLFTIQSDYSAGRLSHALDFHNGINRITQGKPKIWVSQIERGKKAGTIEYTVYDGNHRLGIACLRRIPVEVIIKGLWTEELAEKYPRLPYDVFLKKLKAEGVGELAEYW